MNEPGLGQANGRLHNQLPLALRVLPHAVPCAPPAASGMLCQATHRHLYQVLRTHLTLSCQLRRRRTCHLVCPGTRLRHAC